MRLLPAQGCRISRFQWPLGRDGGWSGSAGELHGTVVKVIDHGVVGNHELVGTVISSIEKVSWLGRRGFLKEINFRLPRALVLQWVFIARMDQNSHPNPVCNHKRGLPVISADSHHSVQQEDPARMGWVLGPKQDS